MGDPRAGEFRAAKVHLGSLWGHEREATEIRGWVLPQKDGEPRWVVAGNGLVYEAVWVGEKANLDKEFEKLFPTEPPEPSHVVHPPEPIAVATSELVSLLLILNRPDLAEPLHGKTNARAFHLPFLSVWFDQAVTAHMRGDDRTALRVGRALLHELPAFEKRAREAQESQTIREDQGGPFPYLAPLPTLVQDAERRLRQGARPALDIEKLKARPFEEQVQTLVDHLDEVSARQWGQPGGVDIGSDPIVARLIEIGVPAGEPLLEAMEKDTRLTRSVSFGRDFHPGRNLIRVKDAAYAAVRHILEVDQLPVGPNGQPSAKMIREYWAANKGKSPTDRWFQTLQDDHAGWRRWEEAATRLFDAQGVRRSGGWVEVRKGPPKAEALRGRTHPSLSELLDKRARAIAFKNDENLPPRMMLPTSLRLAIFYKEWDPKGSLPLLRDLTKATATAMEAEYSDQEQLLQQVVPAIVARHEAGDASAWADYVGIMERVRQLPSFRSEFLRPVVLYADDDRIRPVRRMLTTPGSTFDVVGRLVRDPRVAGYDPLLISPVLKLPEVRQAVLKALDDKRVIGTAWIDARGQGQVEADGQVGPSQGVRSEPKDPKPKVDEKRPLRAADPVAHALARLRGAPKFQPYWTPAEKDAAIGELRKFLMANQDRIDAVVGWPNNWLDPETDRKLRGE